MPGTFQTGKIHMTIEQLIMLCVLMLIVLLLVATLVTETRRIVSRIRAEEEKAIKRMIDDGRG